MRFRLSDSDSCTGNEVIIMRLCEREVSDGVTCDKPAENILRIRDKGTGKVHRVVVCDEHKAEHNRSAAERRAASK